MAASSSTICETCEIKTTTVVEFNETHLKKWETRLQAWEDRLDARERYLNRREEQLNQKQDVQQVAGKASERARCQYCDTGLCSRDFSCFDHRGLPLHRHHNCAACHRSYKLYGTKGGGKASHWGR